MNALQSTFSDLGKSLSGMLRGPVCTVEGCNSKPRGRGLCNMHWLRWRKHGDPLGGRTPNGESLRYFKEVVCRYDREDCLLWPYGRGGNGYAQIGDVYVHRLACESRHGPAPEGKPEAAHSCGNGHLGCVSPKHLRWASHVENMDDMAVQGRSTRTYFSAEEIADICTSRGRITQAAIAAKYAVNRNIITKIQTGEHPAVAAIVDSVARLYGNDDTIMREKALEAICGDRAAFWTMANYSNAIDSSLPYALNAGVDIARAVANAYVSRPFLKPGALDRIVPLNMAAARALSHAYALEGAWRDEAELLMRAKRDCRKP